MTTPSIPPRFELTSDREENTKMLLSIPGLADEVSLTIGNAVFIPCAEEDVNKPWKKFVIDIDHQDMIFICKHTEKPQHIKQLLPATAFTPEGIRHIFRHEDPPPEFAVLACRLAEHMGLLEVSEQPLAL